MPKDSTQLAKDYIDGALEARASLGRSAKPSKAAYERAVRLARLAMDELTTLARRTDLQLAPQRRKAKSLNRAR